MAWFAFCSVAVLSLTESLSGLMLSWPLSSIAVCICSDRASSCIGSVEDLAYGQQLVYLPTQHEDA